MTAKLRRMAISAALVGSMLGASAAHATPREFYGVIPADDPSSTEIKRMGAGRVGTLRVNLYWGAVQPTRGASYDWGHYDQIVGDAAQYGIRVLPTVYGSPPWVSRRPNLPPGRRHWPDFRRFVAAAAQRYGHDGIFWKEHPAVPRLAVHWWQLWNEVNSPSFWYHKPNPKQYVRLLKQFHTGIKSGDAGARIVLAGLFPTALVRNGMDSDRFLRGIYRNRAKRLFDATALHPYSTTPTQALDRATATRRTMAQYKDRKAKLWLTEVGWATGGNPPTALVVSPRRQAKYLRRTYKLLAKNRKRLKIPGVIWYSWRDINGGIWFQHTGLFTADFDPKPAWSAFTGLTGGKR